MRVPPGGCWSPFPTGSLWQPSPLETFELAGWVLIADNVGPLVILLAIALLSLIPNLTRLELAKRRHVDPNRELRAQITRDGEVIRLRRMRPGVFVGELSLYAATTASASVVADEPSVVLVLLAAELPNSTGSSRRRRRTYTRSPVWRTPACSTRWFCCRRCASGWAQRGPRQRTAATFMSQVVPTSAVVRGPL